MTAHALSVNGAPDCNSLDLALALFNELKNFGPRSQDHKDWFYADALTVTALLRLAEAIPAYKADDAAKIKECGAVIANLNKAFLSDTQRAHIQAALTRFADGTAPLLFVTDIIASATRAKKNRITVDILSQGTEH